jgi:multidrug efflux pump subunit AcrA (membrane-fusion protein)
MKAVVRIGESQVWRLREGMRAKVSLTNGAPMDATLAAISVLSDNSQRWWNDAKEYPVDLTLDHTPAGLKPGMGAKCEILIDRVEAALAVPLPAIYTAGPKSFVFVRGEADDDVRAVEVKLGRINEQYAEVRDGLTNGQQVKILQIGEGQELLARSGIKTSIDQPDGAFGHDGKPRGQGNGQGQGQGRGGRRGGGGGSGGAKNGRSGGDTGGARGS